MDPFEATGFLAALGRVSAQAGMLQDQRQLRRRLSMIAQFHPAQRWGWLSVFLLVVLGIVGLTDAQVAKPNRAEAAPKNAGELIADKETGDGREIRRGADPVPEANHTNIPARTLTVIVLDAATGLPLAGAEVAAPYLGDRGKPQLRRLADERGRYILNMPVPGKEIAARVSNFGVSASHETYASRAVMWTSSGGNVYSELPEEVTIKLEQGITIGGVVRDERGGPLTGVRVLLSGSGYRGFNMGRGERRTHEYPEIRRTDKKAPAAFTDEAGRWTFAHFPADLESVEVTLVRPDESQESFSTQSKTPLNYRPIISFLELKAQTAVFTLKDGVTVRGVVVDEMGRPLAGVTVKEGYGHGNMVRVSEFTTGADGLFERNHRAPRQWIYTASRGDRATISVVAQVEPGMGEVRLAMPPAKPLRVRVTDEAGQALAGAEIRVAPYHTDGQILDWTDTTSADGVAIWTNAPTQTVTLDATSKSLGAFRKFKAAGGQAEKLVILSKNASEKITIRGKAVDADTRQPVRVRVVGLRDDGPGTAFKTVAEPGGNEFSLTVRQADFPDGTYPNFRLKLDADGYESLTTERSIDFYEGDQDLELMLTRSSDGGSELIALLPDGRAAAGARIWVRTTPDAGSLYINGPGRYSGDRLAKAQADDEGRFELPGAAGEAPVVIAHTNGFLETTVAELRRTRQARLQSYGALEGRLLVAGEPKGGVNVNLTTLSWSPSLGVHLTLGTPTASDGRFTFTNVPPGEYKLYRWQPAGTRVRSGRAITQTCQKPVTIKPGETVKLEYASHGRAVIGQALPDKPELAVDWRNDDHVLLLKLPPVAPVSREDFASFAAFQKAHSASLRSGAQVKQAREARTYQLAFETDGSFRVEDVPPGSYELRIRLSKPDEKQTPRPFQRPEDELGSLVRDVLVPEGKDPLDLGTLTVALKGEAGGRKSAPVDLVAKTLDGKPWKLADQRGKHALVVFWAAWSDRSREALGDLKKFYADLGPETRLTVVGISLDNDEGAARSAVAEGRYPWTQARLEEGARAQATASFDVNTLPAVFLIDADGRIVGRDLEGERLRMAVRRALQKK